MNQSTNQQVTKILIRADASVQIGIGHVMRCLTLADELRGRGTEVVFVCREFAGNLCGYIEEKGYIVHRLPVSNTPKQNIESGLKHAAWLGADWQTDARQVEEIIKSLGTASDWLVVDHYALDERWEGYLRPYCKKTMVIDDLADRVAFEYLLTKGWDTPVVDLIGNHNTFVKVGFSESIISTVGINLMHLVP